MSFLSFDVGGTRTKWGAVRDGQLTRSGVRDTPRGAQPLLNMLAAVAAELRGEGHQIERAGVGLPGQVDSAAGLVRRSGKLGISMCPLGELAAAQLQVSSVLVVNDLTAACAGEAGASGTMAVLFIGTGIGSKVAFDGHVHTGSSGRAGEVGHLSFRSEGPACRCGARGCAELYAGWGGLQDRYRQAGRPTPAAPGEILAQARGGDSFAAKVLEEACEAVAFAAAALVAATDPGLLRLGGGVSAAWGQTLIECVREQLAWRCRAGAETKIEAVKLGEAAPLLGLARLAARG